MPERPRYQNLINGILRNPDSEDWIDVVNPATGEVFARAANSSASDINEAVAAAGAAFDDWSGLEPEARGRHLNRLAEAVADNAEELAQLETQDCGKPLSASRAIDIPRAVANLRFFAAAAGQFASESHARPGAIDYTLRQPLGPVACISPWNLPLYLFTWKIAPALAAGNTVVGKPSEVTPATAFRLAELSIDAGLPPGVLNIVHGQGEQAGQALVEHADIKAISFTGSTRVGQSIAAECASRLRPVSLEMGGKNPSIVFADCDLEATADAVVRAAFANQGQICLCGSRILIEERIYETFRDLLVDRAQALIVGDPLDDQTNQGAVVSHEHYNKVIGAIATALNEGGNLLCGGEPIKLSGRCADGWFIAPTLIDGLDNQCRSNQEEIFGPVATLQPFKSAADAVQIANDSDYGLAANLWTSDLSRAHRVANALHFGIVWVNTWLDRDLRTPFGGVKASGMGREGGMEALRFFTEPKNVSIRYD